MVQKWAVLPVSAMAGDDSEKQEAVRSGGVEGGPIVNGTSEAEADKSGVRADKNGTNTWLSGASGATIGFPLGHGPGEAGMLRRGPR